ncbi:MAG: ABC transporter ATP-binding protein [Deltaproteobacteria bacterium]|nr:MAG: ABC transporter ATP-binding protein [Deltaproteobacteria bacterium]
MLKLEKVNTFYGESHILKGLSLNIAKGEIATLLGRNGASKTTTVKTIMGILSPQSGTITLHGQNIVGLPPHQIAKQGVGFVPEERRIFPSLTVLENMMFPAWGRGEEGWGLEKIFGFFPALRIRANNRGSQLSGGEQQMLAIARVLRAKMEVILLDEPTEGLAPLLIKGIGEIISETKRSGLTILLIEQNTRFATQFADRHHVLHVGEIVYSGTNDEFKNNHEIQRRYLGI